MGVRKAGDSMRSVIVAAILCPCSVWAAPLEVVPIDLNHFVAVPDTGEVTVAADGTSAMIKEDSNQAAVFLSNDPGLGDLEVVVAGPGVTVHFEYEFTEGPQDNDDMFIAFVLDGSSAPLPRGGNAIDPSDPTLYFSTDVTSAGTVSFDLSGLAGQTVGLEFQLDANLANDVGLDSTVAISNVRLETVPEPSTAMTLGLMGISLVSLAARQRQRVGIVSTGVSS